VSTPPRAPAPLAADRLTKRFGQRVALSDVSLDVRVGERLAVIGPNGAGKTTLLAILAGVLAADEGSVSRETRALGWVPQQPAVYSKLSVAENLRLFARLERVADPEATVERMLEQTGLRERADDELGRLSGGNRQRVNVAIGLLAEPPVLLLDEPSSALDPRQRERLWELIEGQASAGTSIVFSTHIVGEAERYGDRVLVLADGVLVFAGTPDELHAQAPAAARDFEAAFVAFLRARGH
jgi:ABC-2 type transport system ATP-binding protein